MKNFMKVFFCSAIVFGFMIGVAHADAGSAPSTMQVPSWIVAAVKDLENIPAIGHIITLLLGVIAVASVILTPLTALLMAIEKAFNLTGLLPEINFLNQKVIPALAYFSNFNAQPVVAPAPTTTASSPTTQSTSS
jgi:hypothetical protein